MNIRVSIENLKRGMYILDLEDTVKDPSVFSVEGYVLSEDEIPRLLAKGYRAAFIDLMRSRLEDNEPQAGVPLTEIDVIGNAADEDEEPPETFQEEYAKAGDLYGQGLEVTRALSVRVLTGAELPVETERNFMGEMLGSVGRNRNALICLSKMKSREEYLFSHSLNVAIIAVALGRRMKIKERYLPELALAGFLHDVGKLFVNKQVLNHPGKLTREQMQEVQQHVLKGHEYLVSCGNLPQMVLDGELDHQERFSGTGYPGSKKGMDISFTGRLLAVADVYDALSSRRCYKPPLSPAQALSVMYGERAQHFSPGFVEFLISVVGVYPPGSLVKLSNGQTGVVIESTKGAPLQPRIVLLADARGARIRPKILDLVTASGLSVVEPVARLSIPINVEEAVRSVL